MLNRTARIPRKRKTSTGVHWHISKCKDGHSVKVWHQDNLDYWVRFRGLCDLGEARAKIRSAEHMLLEGTSTDDAGATVKRLIDLGFCKVDSTELIGRVARVAKAYTEHGGVGRRHNLLSTAIATKGQVWVLLKDGRQRKVHTHRMPPEDLAKELYYVGGVLYWKDEKKEPIGYDMVGGVLRLFYIGEQVC